MVYKRSNDLPAIHLIAGMQQGCAIQVCQLHWSGEQHPPPDTIHSHMSVAVRYSFFSSHNRPFINKAIRFLDSGQISFLLTPPQKEELYWITGKIKSVFYEDYLLKKNLLEELLLLWIHFVLKNAEKHLVPTTHFSKN